MANGGARPGAGRPKGVKESARADAAKKIIDHHTKTISDLIPNIPFEIARLTPLEVMLKAMSIQAYEGKWVAAAALAKEAAPYIHPRLASVDLNANVRRSIKDFSDAELAALASASLDLEGDGIPSGSEG
jgi:hypothetical protein